MANVFRRLMTSITGTPVDKATQDFLDYAADIGSERLSNYKLYEDYYDGNQRTRLTDRARRYLEQATGLKFCENFCEPIVDTLVERLSVTGFSSTENDTDQDDIAAQTDEWSMRNRMDAKQGVVHTTAVMKGDAFVFVDWADAKGMPRWTVNKPELVKPEYSDSDPDTLEWLSKTWTTRVHHPRLNDNRRAICRLNIYFPDRVEKWFKLHNSEGAGGWQQWQDLTGETDVEGGIVEEAWPVDWTDAAGEPLGIPVVHFRFKSVGKTFGRSRLRSVIPMQDELNKLVLDLNALADNHAYPQQYVIGVPTDANVFKRVIGNIWQASAKDVEFGQLDPANLDSMLKAIEECLSRMARRSRIPMHILTGSDPPSGEALKAAESGLVATAKDTMVNFGNSWEDVQNISLRLAAVFGDGTAPVVADDTILETQWANPESRNDKEDAETGLLLHELGVSQETLLRARGYDPEQEAERRTGETETALTAAQKAMSGGLFAPPGYMGGTA